MFVPSPASRRKQSTCVFTAKNFPILVGRGLGKLTIHPHFFFLMDKRVQMENDGEKQDSSK